MAHCAGVDSSLLVRVAIHSRAARGSLWPLRLSKWVAIERSIRRAEQLLSGNALTDNNRVGDPLKPGTVQGRQLWNATSDVSTSLCYFIVHLHIVLASS